MITVNQPGQPTRRIEASTLGDVLNQVGVQLGGGTSVLLNGRMETNASTPMRDGDAVFIAAKVGGAS